MPRKAVKTTVAFGGWSVVCDQVLHLVGPLCKDPEYMLLLHLFDELLPLLFFLYNTVFKGGDLNQWLTVLLVVISINGLQYFCEFPWCSLYLEGATTTKPHCVSYQTSFITFYCPFSPTTFQFLMPPLTSLAFPWDMLFLAMNPMCP